MDEVLGAWVRPACFARSEGLAGGDQARRADECHGMFTPWRFHGTRLVARDEATQQTGKLRVVRVAG